VVAALASAGASPCWPGAGCWGPFLSPEGLAAAVAAEVRPAAAAVLQPRLGLHVQVHTRDSWTILQCRWNLPTFGLLWSRHRGRQANHHKSPYKHTTFSPRRTCNYWSCMTVVSLCAVAMHTQLPYKCCYMWCVPPRITSQYTSRINSSGGPTLVLLPDPSSASWGWVPC
jgi:hypothetical protein